MIKHRRYTIPVFILAGAILLAHRACAQDPAGGVRLGLSYPRGTSPAVVVMPADSVPNDSVRAIIQRDFDNSDRIRPLILDDATLRGLSPRREGEYNFALLAKFGAAAIVQPVRTAGGYRVALYDVAAKRLAQTAAFSLPRIPQPHPAEQKDSLRRVLTAGDSAARDSARAAFLASARGKRPVNPKDKRKLRFILRDSVTRDSVIRAEVRARMSDFDEARADAVQKQMAPVLRDLYFRDSLAHELAVSDQRMAIHEISDEIERWITGKRGIAQTRVSYVYDGRIHIVDSDGANDIALTPKGLSLSPAWSPDARSIVFSTLSDKGSQIVIVNLLDGQRKILASAASGLNITPVFSPDGRGIVYSTGTDQGTNIVRADLATGNVLNLTVGNRGENASPTFSPDARRVAFLSSRARYPEIYAMDADGSNVELVTPYNPGVRTYRTAPDWSPDGRSIAYEQQNGDFQVWVINLRDKEMRRLTSEGENEGPSWAPDARHLAISSTRSGSKQIWILDTMSGRFRQLTRNPGARLAAWSPIIRVAP